MCGEIKCNDSPEILMQRKSIFDSSDETNDAYDSNLCEKGFIWA